MDCSVNYEYEKKYLELLKDIVLKTFSDIECKIFLFGSRAGNSYSRSSDYDIGIENISKKDFMMKKREVESEVEESIIPHKVDLINFDEAKEDFRKIAYKNVVVWKN
ncbi:MAG TPA: nucleotidyltransferase domain-containing protein [Spirochaetota bacterium]|nr:nucleotidyltransferase domain-containing protein [Spirochaetota bacterium]HOS33455.1 nucleotidyltransferase domain-containing protein [Spirochaetota bacterium]HOS56257.1 nucleotidyltransferase domain-containing protein [Spirochaetota bacterium]HPK62059.1 nucleotidyltransferase domain-containing protein [Spirochaetota bacterium]HQF78664.1 nucleotidyltransferase domain-containing protein [Spirochaetota bacterium]